MTDTLTVRMVVALLGLLGFASVVGVVVLSAMQIAVPDGIWSLGGSAVGALAAVLSRTTTTSEQKGQHAAGSPYVPGR